MMKAKRHHANSKVKKPLAVILALLLAAAFMPAGSFAAQTTDSSSSTKAASADISRASGADTFEQRVVTALSENAASIDVSDFGISTDTISDLYIDVLESNPILFNVRKTLNYSFSGDKVIKITPVYSLDVAAYKTALQDYKNNMKVLLSWTDSSMSDAQKVKAVHDWIVKYVAPVSTEDYDFDNKWRPSTAYEAVVNKKANDEGYMQVFYAAMKYLGINVQNVKQAYSGYTGHAWNRVQVDNNWYNIDVAEDDANSAQPTKFFLRSDTWWKSNHIIQGAQQGEPNKFDKTLEPASPADDYSGDLLTYNEASKFTVTLSKASYSVSYTGAPIPYSGTAAVTDGGGRAVADPSVSYTYSSSETGTFSKAAPSGVGTWYVKGSYANDSKLGDLASIFTSDPVSFSITQADASNAAVTAVSDQTYTGSAVTPTLTVMLGNTALTAGTDYDVTYTNNVDVGTANYTVKFKGNCYGSDKTGTFKIVEAVTPSVTWNMTADTGSTGSVTYDAPPETGKDFTGKVTAGQGYSLPKEITVTVGGKTLTSAQYRYDAATGTFTIYAKDVTGAVVVTALGTKTDKKNAVFRSGAFSFKVTRAAGSSTGTVTLYKLPKKLSKSYTVPATVRVNGCKYKVTAIAAKAFSGSTKLRSVTIGKYVSTIGSRAFYKCSKLTSVKFAGKSVTRINKEVFKTCAKGCTFRIPAAKYKAVVKMLKKSKVPKKAKFKRI